MRVPAVPGPGPLLPIGRPTGPLCASTASCSWQSHLSADRLPYRCPVAPSAAVPTLSSDAATNGAARTLLRRTPAWRLGAVQTFRGDAPDSQRTLAWKGSPTPSRLGGPRASTTRCALRDATSRAWSEPFPMRTCRGQRTGSPASGAVAAGPAARSVCRAIRTAGGSGGPVQRLTRASRRASCPMRPCRRLAAQRLVRRSVLSRPACSSGRCRTPVERPTAGLPPAIGLGGAARCARRRATGRPRGRPVVART